MVKSKKLSSNKFYTANDDDDDDGKIEITKSIYQQK